MVYWLHKILPVFWLPTGVVLILLFLSLATRRRRYVAAAALLMLGLSNRYVVDRLIEFANGHTVHSDPSTMPKAQAIVVLGEGREVAPGEAHYSEWIDGDRFWGGVDLYGSGRAPLLVFTGGTAPDLPNAPLEGQVLKLYAQRAGVRANDILVSDRAYTTEEEAAAVRRLFRPSGGAPSIILVTSAYHMPRAKLLFEHAGFTVVPYPVDFKLDAQREFSPEDFIPQAHNFFKAEFVIREMEGRWFYQLKALCGFL